MRPWLLSLMLLFTVGCTTVQIPGYIQSNHPYSRKFYGDFGKIMMVVKSVLVYNGWKVKTETHPSVYENDSDNYTPDDLLIFTQVKHHSMFLWSSYTHLNVVLHATTEGAEVEIRYGKVTPIIKQFTSTRSDRQVNRLLDQMEQALLEAK